MSCIQPSWEGSSVQCSAVQPTAAVAGARQQNRCSVLCCTLLCGLLCWWGISTHRNFFLLALENLRREKTQPQTLLAATSACKYHAEPQWISVCFTPEGFTLIMLFPLSHIAGKLAVRKQKLWSGLFTLWDKGDSERHFSEEHHKYYRL